VSHWYDALYADDPFTDNIFGREALVPHRNALLHEFLRRGGRLCDFPAGGATSPSWKARMTDSIKFLFDSSSVISRSISKRGSLRRQGMVAMG